MLALDALALTFAVKYGREAAPQMHMMGRIGGAFLLLKQLSIAGLKDSLASRAIRRVLDLGLLNFVIVVISRFHPTWLRLPPTISGKDAKTGQIRWPFWLFWFPWYTAEYVVYKRMTRQRFGLEKGKMQPYNLIHTVHGESLYLGAWPGFFYNKIPDDVGMIFDLCNEYPEPSSITKNREYLCVPIWDHGLPEDTEKFLEYVDKAARFRGTVYVHCVMGLGRSLVATVCILIKRGIAGSIDEACEKIRAVRPMAQLRPYQRPFLDEVLPRLLK